LAPNELMTTVAERAVDAAMEVECKKDSLKQNQDGTWKFTLTIAPGGLPDAMMKAAPGTRYTAVFVEVDDVEEPVKRAPAASEKPRRPFHDLPLSQQAGIRCQDEKFHKFLRDRGWRGIDDAAAVRAECKVSSRSEFDTDNVAGLCWQNLNTSYEIWAGLQADER